jgi:hypothetical protein
MFFLFDFFTKKRYNGFKISRQNIYLSMGKGENLHSHGYKKIKTS